MTTIRSYYTLGGALLIGGLLLGTWFLGRDFSPVGQGGEQVATTTPTTATSSASTSTSTVPNNNTLPPEQPFVLPEGATAVDGYAFIQDDQVYFRSLTGKAALGVPNSDAESFVRLSDFFSYSESAVVNDCGVAPLYAYYGDEKQVYFYQVWRAPEFRSSTVEVIVGAEKENFRVTSPLRATDGSRLFEVSYEKATTTCKLILKRLSLEPAR